MVVLVGVIEVLDSQSVRLEEDIPPVALHAPMRVSQVIRGSERVRLRLGAGSTCTLNPCFVTIRAPGFATQ